MNPFNLIDPFSPREQLRWRRWYSCSLVLFILTIIVLIAYTGQLCYLLYDIKKGSRILHHNGAEDFLTSYQKLCQKSDDLKKDMIELSALNRSLEYHRHLEAIAEKLPSRARLTLIDCNDQEVVLEGQTHELEDILGCVSALNTTKLFERLRLTELQPSNSSFENQKEKKLVNFVIKGKLKAI